MINEETRTYRELADVANSVILSMDTEGRIIFFNRFAQEFFGFSEEEVLGKNVVGTIVPETETWGRDLRLLLDEITHHPDRYANNENENIRCNGERVWVAWTNRGILDEEGRLTEVLCIGNDITRRKRAEEALRESERKYRLLAENVSDVIWVMNPEMTGYEYISPSVQNLLGYTSEELLSLNLSDFLTPASCATIMKGIHDRLEAEKTGDSFQDMQLWEVEYIRKDGTTAWVESTTRAIRDEEGRFSGLIGVARDISARKKAEEALRESEGKYRLLAENVSDVIWVLNKELDQYTYISPSIERLLGLPPEEAIGRHVLSHLAPEYRPIVEEAVRIWLEKEAEGQSDDETQTYELKYLHEDGREIWVESTARPLRGDDGRFAGLIGVTRDISERKEAEREHLELERNLSRARKVESLAVLAGGISHDFNSLLMTIMGNLDMALQDMADAAPQHPFIRAADNAARRAAELTRKMLAYSGRGHFIMGTVNINDIIDGRMQILKALLPATVTLEFNPAPDLPEIEADANQIEQILSHLVTNAVEAFPSGADGHITINTGIRYCSREELMKGAIQEDRDEGNYIVLEIRDNGAGIDVETREKIFEPFFSTKFTGRGLGLSAVMGIVRGHLGVIHVDSAPDQGTSISVLLPVASAEESEEEETETEPKKSILLADDEIAIRRLCAAIIRRMGLDVIIASTGHMAIDLFRKQQQEITCAVLDVNLPGINGCECLRRIHELDPECPVILISGYPEQDIRDRLGEEKISAFLKKPFHMNQMQQILQNIIDSRKET